MKGVYYNEFDAFPAQWIRNLIDAGELPPGLVDERDVQLVEPHELQGYSRHHFFAGIAGWELALQLAGWPVGEPVWTASLPCQPFSAAGERKGFDDERHLWPTFRELIEKQAPRVILGEQVASAAGREWFDVVSADLEALGYASAAVDLCAASVGAPHIRQRLYWVAIRMADTNDKGSQGLRGLVEQHGEERRATPARHRSASSLSRRLADAASQGRQRHGRQLQGGNDVSHGAEATQWQHGGQRTERLRDAGEPREVLGLANARGERRQQNSRSTLGNEAAHGRAGRLGREPNGDHIATGDGESVRPSEVDSGWGVADWLYCQDGKWRPVEPGLEPLAARLPNHVGSLRAYGNAIVPQLAAAFIKVVMIRLNIKPQEARGDGGV